MNEELFRRMAAEYVQQSGAALHSEQNALSQNETPQITPNLDRRVRGKINALKRRRYAGITGLVAACLALAILVPTVLNFQHSSTPADFEADGPTVQAYEIIPLSFEMPEQFSVSAVEQDIEKTVYYIENSELDDVVMTLERTDNTSLFDELTRISINGHSAYGSSGKGYCLLTFEKHDILYVLTCAHDINTLVELSESILFA